jgi:asparagine N-glycosylation enzyme membrane subunit Stt3
MFNDIFWFFGPIILVLGAIWELMKKFGISGFKETIVKIILAGALVAFLVILFLNIVFIVAPQGAPYIPFF